MTAVDHRWGYMQWLERPRQRILRGLRFFPEGVQMRELWVAIGAAVVACDEVRALEKAMSRLVAEGAVERTDMRLAANGQRWTERTFRLRRSGPGVSPSTYARYCRRMSRRALHAVASKAA